MANNIKAKIYKNRIAACKYANKVNGHVVKEYKPELRQHGKHAIFDKMAKCYYVVYWGKYNKV